MDIKSALATLQIGKKKEIPHQMFTRWGEELIGSQEQVLAKYPRPQLVRRNYTVLNGWWNYAFTDSMLRPVEYEGEILVPFSPESALSGVGKVLMPGACLWYVRSLLLEEIPEKKRLILHFGAVDQTARVYVNHSLAGEHTGGYLPFSIDITDYLTEGENELCVMVRDTTDTSWHSRGKQKLTPGGMFYSPQSGIWQTVWMEWVPEIYLEYLNYIPLYEEETIRIQLKYAAGIKKLGIKKRILIKEGRKVIAEVETQQNTVDVKLPEMKSWSPEHPFLYQVEILAGEDRVESYFAMRKIAVKKEKQGIRRIFLNNKPYFMNGVLDQGYYPDGLMTAPSDEAMIYDIKSMKELGFNMLRKHCKIEPARWYYHCDRLGMLVWQDMVNGGEAYKMELLCYIPNGFTYLGGKINDHNYSITSRNNKDGRRQWLKECRETVRMLRSYPCIVAWIPFNEGWGQFDSLKVCDMVRKLDSTRLIDAASGWFDQGGGDIKSDHNYFRPLQVKTGKRAYAISEYGGYICHIDGHSYVKQSFGYHTYPSPNALRIAVARLQKEIKELERQGLSAAVYTQLSDIEEEVNGILTYDRRINKWRDCLRIEEKH